MKIAETLIAALLKYGAIGEMKNFKTEINIPGATDKDPYTMIVITADYLHVKMDSKGDK